MPDLKFFKSYPPYMPGDVATFTDELARKLVTRRVALPHPVAQDGEPAPVKTSATSGSGKADEKGVRKG